MGIRTPYVDALTFGLGCGIAGLAGVALSQIDNVSPNLGQGYIIDSFMVVVFGGVGNLWGTLVGAMSLGILNKLLEPYARRRARQDHGARSHHPLHPEAAARALCPQGPGGGIMMTSFLTRRIALTLVVLAAIAILVPALNLWVPDTSPFHVPDRLIPLWGKYACYALLALSLDLVWGYCGILSLGHGAFFAIGGYAMRC